MGNRSIENMRGTEGVIARISSNMLLVYRLGAENGNSLNGKPVNLSPKQGLRIEYRYGLVKTQIPGEKPKLVRKKAIFVTDPADASLRESPLTGKTLKKVLSGKLEKQENSLRYEGGLREFGEMSADEIKKRFTEVVSSSRKTELNFS